VSFRRWYRFPKELNQFREILTEVFFFLKPCDPTVERTFPVFSDLLSILNRGSFAQTSALLMRSPEGLNEQDCASLKKLGAPHEAAVLFRISSPISE
jgi:hypothetical protein